MCSARGLHNTFEAARPERGTETSRFGTREERQGERRRVEEGDVKKKKIGWFRREKRRNGEDLEKKWFRKREQMEERGQMEEKEEKEEKGEKKRREGTSREGLEEKRKKKSKKEREKEEN